MAFSPPFPLYSFQVDLASRMYYQENTILSASTGTGKGLMSLCTAALLHADDKIDHIIIACEKSKLFEWADEIEAFTDLEYVIYAGDKTKRAKMRKALPTVIIGVYETIRNDSTIQNSRPGSRGRLSISTTAGELLEAIEGKRVLMILDEAPAKLGASRTSQMYKTYLYARKHLGCRIMVLSATPVDRDIEGYFNLLRLIDPEFMKVEDFYRYYAQGYDLYNRVNSYKNITSDACAPGVISFKDKASKYLLVKNKNDPDVAKFFPAMPLPDYSYIRLDSKVQEFYEMVVQYFTGGDNDRTLFTLARQISGHPQSLLHSDGEMAHEVVRLVGEKFLRSLATDKLDALVNRLKMFRREGAQVVVFTFFGQSILPLIYERLVEEKFNVVTNHGQLSHKERDVSQKAFKAGDAEIFLSSDAGARGINLPTAQYVEEYEAPLKNSIHTQRINRISRINSTNKVVFSHTFVAKDSIEESIVDVFLKRKEWDETLTVEGRMDAATLRRMLEIKRLDK